MKLSFTSVQTYLENPRKFLYQYILKYRAKTQASALVFGSAIDKGLNILLTTRNLPVAIEYFKDALKFYKFNGETLDLDKTDCITYTNGDIDLDVLEESQAKGYILIVEELREKKRNEGLTLEEQRIFNQIALLCLRKKGEMMLEAYNEQVMPKIKKVIDVQKSFSIKNEDEDEFIGVIDLICEWDDGVNKGIANADNKTTSVKFADDSVKTSEQLATYEVAEDYRNDFSVYIAISKKIRKKKEPRVAIQIIVDKVDQATIDKTFAQYDEVNMKVKLGEFPKNCDSCKINKYYQKCAYSNICFHGDFSDIIIKKD